MNTKTFGDVTMKAVSDTGAVSAVIATIGVVDRDGDVMMDGCLPAPVKVTISPYNHALWSVGTPGIVPLGYGEFKQDGDHLVFSGQFNMDIQAAREAHADIKMAMEYGVNTEWSFSLQDKVVEQVKVNGVAGNGIKSFAPREVCRVVQGASVGSGTTAVKSAMAAKQLMSSVRRLLSEAGRNRWPGRYSYVEDFDTDAGLAVFELYNETGGGYALVQVSFTRTDTSVELGPEETAVHETTVYLAKSKFSEHATKVLADVDGLAERARAVVALRAEKGKSISDESAGLLSRVVESLEAVKAVLDEPDTTTETGDTTAEEASPDEVDALFLEYVAITQGVTQS